MDDLGGPHLWGRERRYMLTELLWEHGPMTVAELVTTLATDGWRVGGRSSKTISDALRWEIAHGRVVRLGRGLYGPGRMPKQTKSWIRCRNRRTREEAWEQLETVRHGAGHRRTAGAGLETGTRRALDTTAPTPSGPAVPHAAVGPSRPRARPSTPSGGLDQEVAVVGAGWSEDEDAAEDEAVRQLLLEKLRPGP